MKPTDGDDLAAAIREFETALPGWWWTVGSCSLTRDASCGPRAMCGPDCFDDVVDKAELIASTRVSIATTLTAPLQRMFTPFIVNS